jgi:hypothetical protein
MIFGPIILNRIMKYCLGKKKTQTFSKIYEHLD